MLVGVLAVPRHGRRCTTLTDSRCRIRSVAAETARGQRHSRTEYGNCPWRRQRVLLKPSDRHPCQHAPGRTAVDADVACSISFEKFAVNGGNVLARSREPVGGPFAVIQADDSNQPQGGEGHRLELGASGPTTGKSAAMEIEEHALAIACSDPRLGRIDKGMHAGNARILLVDCKQLTLPRKVRREQGRYSIGLKDHLRVLHLL